MNNAWDDEVVVLILILVAMTYNLNNEPYSKIITMSLFISSVSPYVTTGALTSAPESHLFFVIKLSRVR